jgi:stearoyl-CoA desaturase (delta-9 desaturase)
MAWDAAVALLPRPARGIRFTPRSELRERREQGVSSIQATTLSLPTATRIWRRLNWTHILWWALLQVGVLLAPFTFSWSGLALCAGLYLLTGFGITVGYHRLLTHRSFRAPRAVERALAVLGALASQGGPLQWVAVHRIHHRHSDTEGDPHSPRDGLWWAHLLWWFPYTPALSDSFRYRSYVRDLSGDPVLRFLQRYNSIVPPAFALIVFLAGTATGGLGLSWLVWGVFVRTSLVYHATWLVNSATHRWGYRSHKTEDDSTNLWWVALVSLGEGWHNNHHALPRSARHGQRWWEIDVSYYLIRLLGSTGLATHIHIPGKILKRMPSVLPPSPAIPAPSPSADQSADFFGAACEAA